MIENFLSNFGQMILDFVISIVNFILFPFDLLIENFFPDFSSFISNINNALSVCLQYIGWVIDSTGIENITIIFIVDYLIFKLTLPLTTWVIKIAIKWYNNLKL